MQSKGFEVILIIISIIVALIIGLAIGKGIWGEKEPVKEIETSSEERDFKHIRINENIDKDGKIEGLENVRWHNAMINQDDKTMEVRIDVNNESKEEKVESKELTVNLLDKDKKVIYSKDVTMAEIENNYGYTILEVEFQIDSPVLVDDIQIKVK